MELFQKSQLEIGIDYACGCCERWPVSRIPDDEAQIWTVDYVCAPSVCTICAPIYQKNNLSWCNQPGFSNVSEYVSLSELAERTERKKKPKHYTRDRKS